LVLFCFLSCSKGSCHIFRTNYYAAWLCRCPTYAVYLVFVSLEDVLNCSIVVRVIFSVQNLLSIPNYYSFIVTCSSEIQTLMCNTNSFNPILMSFSYNMQTRTTDCVPNSNWLVSRARYQEVSVTRYVWNRRHFMFMTHHSPLNCELLKIPDFYWHVSSTRSEKLTALMKS
jgi:hypothetical protein